MFKGLLLVSPVYFAAIFYVAGSFYEKGYLETLGYSSTLFPVDTLDCMEMGALYLIEQFFSLLAYIEHIDHIRTIFILLFIFFISSLCLAGVILAFVRLHQKESSRKPKKIEDKALNGKDIELLDKFQGITNKTSTIFIILITFSVITLYFDFRFYGVGKEAANNLLSNISEKDHYQKIKTLITLKSKNTAPGEVLRSNENFALLALFPAPGNAPVLEVVPRSNIESIEHLPTLKDSSATKAPN